VPQQLIAARIGSVIGHFNALFSDSLTRTVLSTLDMPILCMTGAQTRPAPRRIAELLRVALPRARHSILDGMGHMGPLTHADVVNRQVVQFLDRRPDTAARSTELLQAA